MAPHSLVFCQTLEHRQDFGPPNPDWYPVHYDWDRDAMYYAHITVFPFVWIWYRAVNTKNRIYWWYRRAHRWYNRWTG